MSDLDKELIQYRYETDDLGKGWSDDNFWEPVDQAGFYRVPGKVYGNDQIFAYSPLGVVISLHEITSPAEEPVNQFRMHVVTNNPKSQEADQLINKLLLQLPMFTLKEEKKVTLKSQ